MQITFKSGAQIEVDVEDFAIGRSPVSDRLVSLKWTTPETYTAKLGYLGDLDDIAAIVRIEDPNMVSFTPED
jgi:hypothetical protein